MPSRTMPERGSLDRLLLMVAMMPLTFSAHAQDISTQAIAETWTAYGEGVVRFQNRMLFLMEHHDSNGVMVVSPAAYPKNIALRYEVMPMNAASVCVAILSASDRGDGTSLTLPESYDGGMRPWAHEIHSYFFAFHNAAHDRTPFAVRFPSGQQIGEHESNTIRSGVFHAVEIVRREGTLVLSVNGERLFAGDDAQPLGSGHIAFRIRGINGIPAACLIRNVTITEE